MLDGSDDGLSPREAALARYATVLTARPWAVGRADVDDLAAQGFTPEQIEAATGVVAMFNYFTRVADASGIDFDYASPLPRFRIERDRDAVARPPRDSWPDIPPAPPFPSFDAVREAWTRWHAYVLDSDAPLPRGTRLLLARAAAEECCDRRRADELSAHAPATEAEHALDAFARDLSRTPWRMTPAHLDSLRRTGLPEPAILHAISVVAHQNSDSRRTLAHAAAS
ncbi:MAG TPA: hypothetical protein VGD67_26915 [Pseudonocardiaceae bacterium]